MADDGVVIVNDAPTEGPPLKKGPGVQYQIPVRNAFEVLGDSSRRKKQPVTYEEPLVPKGRRMPPITIPRTDEKGAHQPSEIRKLVESQTKDFNLKYSGSGIVIFATNQLDHNKITSALMEKSIEHFSHPTEKSRLKRFVLYGLPKLEIGEITSLVKQSGLTPSRISYLTTNKPRFVDQCNYILHFEAQSTTTLSQLKDIKAINHTIVQWAYYRPTKAGISVCRNCCEFGHGAVNCGMSPKCTICAGPHKFTDCKFLIKKHEGNFQSIHQKHIKCANCGGNHTATYSQCPSRTSYIATIEARKPKRSSPGAAASSRRQLMVPVPALNEANFPSPVYNAEPTRPHGDNWSQVVQNHHQRTHPTTTHNQTNDLFSIDECQQIMFNLIDALQQCSSKQDQIKVIASFSFKYCCLP